MSKHLSPAYQLYSAREDASNDLEGVLDQLSRMGYEGVEFAGFFEKTAKEVGIWLYLADAADDYESDLKNRRFNPFGNRPPQKEALLAALDCHCEQAELMLRRLPVFDPGYRNILLNILSQGLHESISSALNSSGKRKEFS